MKIKATGSWSLKFRAFGIDFYTARGTVNELWDVDNLDNKLKFTRTIHVPGGLDLLVTSSDGQIGAMVAFRGFPLWGQMYKISDLIKDQKVVIPKINNVRGLTAELTLEIVQ